MNLAFSQFDKTTYPYLDDSYIDNYIPVAYGKIASVQLTPINSNQNPDSDSTHAVYRMPDGITDYGTARVYINDTYVAATVESVDYDTGLLTISNGRSGSGSTYDCELVDCYGYMFDQSGDISTDDRVIYEWDGSSTTDFTSSTASFSVSNSQLIVTGTASDFSISKTSSFTSKILKAVFTPSFSGSVILKAIISGTLTTIQTMTVVAGTTYTMTQDLSSAYTQFGFYTSDSALGDTLDFDSIYIGKCSYPRQILQHWFSKYGKIEYTASNFDKTEWEAELDDPRVQADIGFFLDDYDKSADSKTSYDIDYLWQVVYDISSKSKFLFRVDYNATGKITARLKDYSRAVATGHVYASSDIKNHGEIPIETSKDNVYSKIHEKYYYDTVNDSYLSFDDFTYENYVKQNYRRMQEYTDKTYLINKADALARASEIALTFKDIPMVATVDLSEAYDLRLYDVITVALMPDNLDASSRKYAGNHDCLVIGVSPKLDQGYNEVQCAIIPDRTPLESQVAVRNEAFNTITREKSAVEIIKDNLQGQITDNLLLTGNLSLVSINLNATPEGVVSDFSAATGTFNVKYSGTDVTGAGPEYSVVSQTGCTGTIDAATGVYAVSALSADVGILLVRAAYQGSEIETSFTVTKAYSGTNGTNGIDAAAISISDPSSTTPESGMAYDNTYYGMYSGLWYKWAWSSTTTGSWTQVSADTPPTPAVRYSFDDMPDLPDDSGAMYKVPDKSFTSTAYWTAEAGSISLSNGCIINTSTANGFNSVFNKSVSIADKVVKCYFKLSSFAESATIYYYNGANIAIASILSIQAGKIYEISALVPSDATLTELRLNIIGAIGTVETISAFYIGDGTTSQPIIDNVSGACNSTAQSGIVSTTGVSGKACQFLGYRAVQLDLSKYANAQSWWVSFWVNYTADGLATIRRFLGFGYKFFSLADYTENPYFRMFNGTTAFGVAVPRTLIGNGSWHNIIVQCTIESSSSASMKLYMDGILSTSASSTADFTSQVFPSSCFLGGNGISSDVMSGSLDDFQFGVGEITAPQALGLYLQRASAAKLYTLADYNYDNSVSSWEITSSAASFSKSRSGVVTPAAVTFFAKAVIASVATAYSGRFIIYTSTDGTTFTPVYTSSSDESSHVYTTPSDIAAFRVELYKAGGTSTLVATQDYSVPYAADVAPEYLRLGLLADVDGLTTKAFTSATITDTGVITPGSTISNIIPGDWMINYTAGTYRALGIYYWSGSAWTLTSDSKYTSDGVIEDICRLNNGGILIPDWTVYANLIADNLFSHTIKLTEKTIGGTTYAGVFYGGDRFNADGSIADRSKDGFYFSTNGKGWCNLQSDDLYNTIAGTDAGLQLISGAGNIGKYNALYGFHAGHNLTSGYNNAILGTSAGHNLTSGDSNAILGASAGYNLTSGDSNAILGASAGFNLTSGDSNAILGAGAGFGLTTADYCVMLGGGAQPYNSSWNYQCNINNRIIYLEFASTATQDTVYQAITNYIGTTVGLVIPCMGLFDAANKGIVLIYRDSSTVLTLHNNNDTTELTLKSGSSTNIGHSLQVCFIAFATPTNT